VKKFLTKALYLGIVLSIAGLAGCEVPLEPRAQAPAQGMGRIVVSIGGGPARTVVPVSTEFDKITWYVLSFSGPKAVEDRNIGPVGETIELPAGTWTITATGWGEVGVGNSDVEVAEGSVQVTVADGDTAEAAILLAPIPDGDDGTFRYSITLPSKPAESEFTLSTVEGAVVKTIEIANYSTVYPHAFQGSQTLAPGEYVARIRLRYGTARYMGLTEVIHVYSRLNTRIDKVFTHDDYRETVSEFNLSGKVTAPVAWAAPVRTFSQTSQYDASGPNGTNVAWQESNGTPVSSAPGTIFVPNTVYKAVVSLAVLGGWTFDGVPADAFAYTGADTVTNSADSGVVTITFPATANNTITGVTITPASPSVEQGGQASFSAVVTGTVTPPQAVTWSVSGNNHAGTIITQAGVLTVALEESAATLTVKAAPIADPAYALGTTTVTVTAAVPAIAISNESDLAKIGVDDSYPVGGKYQLAANLTLSEWTPIASAAVPFRGIFDGNSKTITLNSFSAAALSSNPLLGIFSSVQGTAPESRAVIKDLTIVSSVNGAPSSGAAAGLLAGYAENAEFSGITLSGSFALTTTGTGARHLSVGGIAGIFREGVMENCVGNLAVTVSDSGSSATTVNGVSIGNYGYAGGLVGYVSSAAAALKVAIINCSHTGDIALSSARSFYCGGIAGYVTISAGESKIEGCSSIGNISAVSTYSQGNGDVGGIAGFARTIAITGSRAEGSVSAEAKGNPVNVGGMVGEFAGAITKSYFNGTLTGNYAGSLTNNLKVGGIAGLTIQGVSSRIEDCWSHGTISANGYGVGGIVVIVETETSIARCYSTAAITCTGTVTDVNNSRGIGGIAGINRSTTDYGITSCVALNPTVSSAGYPVLGRVLANFAEGQGITNNYAWSGMVVAFTGGSYEAEKGTDKKDGADVAAAQLNQAFYTGLGWDFTAGAGVWAMDANGYPKLQWQQTEISRSPLSD
jgi:hypothetical protein